MSTRIPRAAELASLLDEILELIPYTSEDDPMAAALADWARRARAVVRQDAARIGPGSGDTVIAQLERVANDLLGFDTLAERRHDRLDFRECHVGNIRCAMIRAFNLGRLSAGGRALDHIHPRMP